MTSSPDKVKLPLKVPPDSSRGLPNQLELDRIKPKIIEYLSAASQGAFVTSPGF
jgi:hypothetical protein